MNYGRTYNGQLLNLFHIRPYLQPNVRHVARKEGAETQAIWLEAGFEGANLAGVQVVLEVYDYLKKMCPDEKLPHCSYDYYILPEANPDGCLYAKTSPSWTKTREKTTGSCSGVNLLNNFKHGRFDLGTDDECSEKYRGLRPMSSIEASYQTKIKEQIKAHIALSVTVSKLGSVITAPFAHTSGKRFNERQSIEHMKVFTEATETYTSGFYSEVHGMDYGHPMDYSAFKYGNSYNVAIEKGTLSDENYYMHEENRTIPIFLEFAQGFFKLTTHAVEENKRRLMKN